MEAANLAAVGSGPNRRLLQAGGIGARAATTAGAPGREVQQRWRNAGDLELPPAALVATGHRADEDVGERKSISYGTGVAVRVGSRGDRIIKTVPAHNNKHTHLPSRYTSSH